MTRKWNNQIADIKQYLWIVASGVDLAVQKAAFVSEQPKVKSQLKTLK